MIMYPMMGKDGKTFFPPYMTPGEKEKMKEKTDEDPEYLFCACRKMTKEKLYYRLSSDLRFIPVHHGYEHSKNCQRGGRLKRPEGYLVNDDGSAVAYLKFNCTNFAIPKEDNKNQNQEEPVCAARNESGSCGEKTKKETKKPEKQENGEKEEKEPYLDLITFVKAVNYDTYMNRLLTGKKNLSADYFAASVWGHTRDVYISGIKKPLHDLNLDRDKVSFFYNKYGGTATSATGFMTLALNIGEKQLQYMINDRIYAKAAKKFADMYEGLEPDSCQNVMAAGFLYKKVSRAGKEYKTVGRLCLFRVNYNGLFCDDMQSQQIMDRLSSYAYSNRDKGYVMQPCQNLEDEDGPVAFLITEAKDIAFFKDTASERYKDTYSVYECRNESLDYRKIDAAVRQKE